MAYLFQVEKTNPLSKSEPTIIKSDAVVLFDVLPNLSTETGHIPDFLYDAETGVITLLKPGSYLVNWSVSQLTGLSRTGQNFQLWIQEQGARTHRTATSHSPAKQAANLGFSIIKLDATQIPAKLSLKNAADQDAALSTTTEVVASLSLYGTPPPASFQDSMHLQLSPAKFNKAALDYETNPPREHPDKKIGFEVYGLGQLIDPDTFELAENGVPANPIIPFDRILADAASATPRTSPRAPFSNDGLIQLDGAYVEATGQVLVYESGRYELKWEVPVEATYSTENAYISLQVSYDHLDEAPIWSTYSKSYMPLPTGVVIGSALIDLDNVSPETGVALRLINDSHTKIRVSHFANWIIKRVW